MEAHQQRTRSWGKILGYHKEGMNGLIIYIFECHAVHIELVEEFDGVRVLVFKVNCVGLHIEILMIGVRTSY